MAHGEGQIKYPNGESYNGYWIEDQYHGKGVYIYSNGETYAGYWKHNLKHGNGTDLVPGKAKF